MYGDERPHDKTLKVNTGLFIYFSFPSACSDIAHFVRVSFRINPACMCVCVSARACVRVCPRVRACVWFHSKPDKLKCSLL